MKILNKTISLIKKIFNKKNDIKFQGWYLASWATPPWIGDLKNNLSVHFNEISKNLEEKIDDKSFQLTQFKSENSKKMIQELKYRHYYVLLAAYLATSKCVSKNFVECGVCDGLTSFFILNQFTKSENYNGYLYDLWQPQKNYEKISLEVTKNNLREYNKLSFNKGSIPSVFSYSINPERISLLHIDLNNAKATTDSLEYFYNKIEKNGIILFDDYGSDTFVETKNQVEIFLENKDGIFFQFPTNQAIFIKS